MGLLFFAFAHVSNRVKGVTQALLPVMKSLGIDENPYWKMVQNAVILTDHFTLIVEGKWNGTSQVNLLFIVFDVQVISQITTTTKGTQFKGGDIQKGY